MWHQHRTCLGLREKGRTLYAGCGDTAGGAHGHSPQQDRLIQVLLFRTAHEDGKFSMMASSTLPLGTVPLSSGVTSLSGTGSWVCLAHMAVLSLHSVTIAWG